MNKRLFFAGFLLFINMALAQAQNATLSGYVTDASSGDELIGAAVYLKELQSGAVTNVYGFYSLSVKPGTYTVVYSYLGYISVEKTVEVDGKVTVKVELETADKELDEVVVTGEVPDQNVTSTEMSTTKLDIQQVKKVPQLLGEVDVVRTLQLLPGVTSVGEGASGFNVRGGDVDQNLVLIDDAPIYNSSHLFGFFSVFNSDAVKDVKLYKGGIPSRYGGRLSSVLDVRQTEGNQKGFGVKGGIGVISSRLMVEGPIVKDKASFMVAGRRSYADIFLGMSNDPAIRDTKAYFYDMNGKVNWKISDRDRIFLSGYWGRDVFGFSDQFGFDWGNKAFTARWNHLFSDQLFTNFTYSFGDYDYALAVSQPGFSFEWRSKIITHQGRSDFSYYINPNNQLNFGVEGNYQIFEPGNINTTAIDENGVEQSSQRVLDYKYASNVAGYIGHEFKIGQLSLDYGIRYSQFQNLGPKSVTVYQDPNNIEKGTEDSVRYYAAGEPIVTYDGWEPRFAATLKLNSVSSVKASYNRMYQYLHLISNTTAITPIDNWAPADQYIKPAFADQVALGYFRNFRNNMYEASVEVYYKEFNDLVDYKDGAELVFNNNLETELLTGKGRAYGLELLLRKQTGRLTGWIAYTYSRSFRTVAGINQGLEYAANYDKPHDLTLVSSYTINKRWDVSGSLVYSTGRPITYPDSKFEFEGSTYPVYTNRNGARTPDYHRLDLSAIFSPKKNEGRRFKSSWVFSVYNVYGRRNPYSIYFQETPGAETNQANAGSFATQAVQLSIIGQAIPAVTYNFTY